MKINAHTILSILIVGLGLLQAIGYISKSKIIKGIGAASCASPLPIVFTKVKDLETFSSRFEVEIKTTTNTTHKIKITPENYSELKGPYNRRNIYGAAFAYGPILPEHLWKSVLTYGFSEKGTLGKELGIKEPIKEVKVHISNDADNDYKQWTLKINCP